jgi:2-iminobutanoate/2-iminopropanoate deaminase
LADGWLYVSGQVPVRADGSVVAGSAAEQAEQVIRNAEAYAASAGGTLSNVVSMTVSLTNVSDIDAIDAAVRRVFDDGAYPARTTVQVAALGRPDFDVEISVVARLA